MRPHILVELMPSATASAARPTPAPAVGGGGCTLPATAVRVCAPTADARERRRAAGRQVLGLGLPGSTTASSCALHGRKAGRLPLLVLLAAQRLTSSLVPVSEKLALRVDNLVQVLAGPEEVLERDGTHGRGDDVDVLLLGAAEEVRLRQLQVPTQPSRRTPSCWARWRRAR